MLNIDLKKILSVSAGLFLITLLMASFQLRAEDQSEKVKQTVEDSVQALLKKFNEEKSYYDTDPDRFFANMDASLSNIVDFRRIAARVMGKYGRSATDTQKDKFVKVFKESLYNTYTKTLIDSGVFKINVNKAEINSRSDEKASVYMDIISANGTVFPVIYSMHKTDDQKWMMENVIVFGVNIGLAFRDKFELEYRKHRGDIDQVINAWSVDLELKGAVEQAQASSKDSQG
ncbi:MAG: phospholipid-binding protein MlaC [Oleiphilus sp.]